MRFKSKDLTVTLSPSREHDGEAREKLCVGGSVICLSPTIKPCLHPTWWGCDPCTFKITFDCFRSGGCGWNNSCGWDRSTCDPTIFPCAGFSRFVLEDPADLVTLKEQLQDLIQEIDKVDVDSFGPQFGSAAEAEQAEAALEEALDKVRSQKKNLK